jgi:hypothetical protein
MTINEQIEKLQKEKENIISEKQKIREAKQKIWLQSHVGKYYFKTGYGRDEITLYHVNGVVEKPYFNKYLACTEIHIEAENNKENKKTNCIPIEFHDGIIENVYKTIECDKETFDKAQKIVINVLKGKCTIKEAKAFITKTNQTFKAK